MNGMRDSKNQVKQDKLTDKAFMHSITVSILGIVICLVVLSSVTWAWFSAGVSSQSNTIQAADYTPVVTVTDSSSSVVLTPAVSSDGTMVYTVTADQKYTVTISATGSARTGYCQVIMDGVTYYTAQVATNAEYGKTQIEFELQPQGNAITIVPRWGSRSDTTSPVLG